MTTLELVAKIYGGCTPHWCFYRDNIYHNSGVLAFEATDVLQKKISNYLISYPKY